MGCQLAPVSTDPAVSLNEIRGGFTLSPYLISQSRLCRFDSDTGIPVDCQEDDSGDNDGWGEWSSWTGCDDTSFDNPSTYRGEERRFRTCKTQNPGPGECLRSNTEIRPCGLKGDSSSDKDYKNDNVVLGELIARSKALNRDRYYDHHELDSGEEFRHHGKEGNGVPFGHDLIEDNSLDAYLPGGAISKRQQQQFVRDRTANYYSSSGNYVSWYHLIVACVLSFMCGTFVAGLAFTTWYKRRNPATWKQHGGEGGISKAALHCDYDDGRNYPYTIGAGVGLKGGVNNNSNLLASSLWSSLKRLLGMSSYQGGAGIGMAAATRGTNWPSNSKLHVSTNLVGFSRGANSTGICWKGGNHPVPGGKNNSRHHLRHTDSSSTNSRTGCLRGDEYSVGGGGGGTPSYEEACEMERDSNGLKSTAMTTSLTLGRRAAMQVFDYENPLAASTITSPVKTGQRPAAKGRTYDRMVASDIVDSIYYTAGGGNSRARIAPEEFLAYRKQQQQQQVSPEILQEDPQSSSSAASSLRLCTTCEEQVLAALKRNNNVMSHHYPSATLGECAGGETPLGLCKECENKRDFRRFTHHDNNNNNNDNPVMAIENYFQLPLPPPPPTTPPTKPPLKPIRKESMLLPKKSLYVTANHDPATGGDFFTNDNNYHPGNNSYQIEDNQQPRGGGGYDHDTLLKCYNRPSHEHQRSVPHHFLNKSLLPQGSSSTTCYGGGGHEMSHQSSSSAAFLISTLKRYYALDHEKGGRPYGGGVGTAQQNLPSKGCGSSILRSKSNRVPPSSSFDHQQTPPSFLQNLNNQQNFNGNRPDVSHYNYNNNNDVVKQHHHSNTTFINDSSSIANARFNNVYAKGPSSQHVNHLQQQKPNNISIRHQSKQQPDAKSTRKKLIDNGSGGVSSSNYASLPRIKKEASFKEITPGPGLTGKRQPLFHPHVYDEPI